MAERFIEFNQWDDQGLILIEPENIVGIQNRPYTAMNWSEEEKLKKPRCFVYLRNSNIFFQIADTVENIRRLVEKKW